MFISVVDDQADAIKEEVDAGAAVVASGVAEVKFRFVSLLHFPFEC